MIATAQEGETVDALCWRVLGRTRAVCEQVLAANPGLADYGPLLPAGLQVTLPDAAALARPTREIVQLWD